MAELLGQLKAEIVDEVAAILASDFQVTATTTQNVPHSGDSAITFPNLDTGILKTKILTTCVLHVDIRRSTDLNLQHKPQTVSKLYSAFVRAMTRCAQHHNAHVRGIIGDRVMVVFEPADCFVCAVETAQSMNSAAKYILNRYFKANEFSCGIGIDYGRMLVTKTGFRRHGYEQQNYQSLIWLGRPANVASKLTDLAGKVGESQEIPFVRYAQANYQKSEAGLFGAPPSTATPNALASALLGQPAAAPSSSGEWQWSDMGLQEFVEGFERDYRTGGWAHKTPRLEAFFVSKREVTVRPSTPPILMTKSVYEGYRTARPNAPSVKGNWYRKYDLSVPGRTGEVYGGDVHWRVFAD